MVFAMAVADVGVAMGPRNRRRLTATAVTLAASLALALAAVILWRTYGAPTNVTTYQSAVTPKHITLITDNLPYGLSRTQMRARLGAPEKVAGSCWQYHVGVKNFAGGMMNAQRLCFTSNMYDINYIEIDGKWRAPGKYGIMKVIPPPTR